MLEPIPFAGMVEIDESFDRTASHMAGEYVSYNEPVAWMSNDSFEISSLNTGKFDIPLYTYPAKTLTDEEIEGIARANVDGHSSMEQLKWFAKAILRKAQKK